ncbi:MAG: hypothetical protein J6P93_04635, partial [Alphaproteobacteria bacterium]|nr:hypothetical protein [Alphaproteobacteria bacterium]
MKRFLLVFLFAFLLTAPVQSSPMVQVSPVWHKDSNPGVQMKIPTTQDLKLASFKRNGYTYFIFQSSEKLQLDETALQKLPLVRLAHPSALILRGVFSENMQPEFYIQNHTLFLKMGTGGNKESSIDTKWLLNGAFLELNDVGLVEFKDPNTLENFFAFLTPYSPLHMDEKYDTPEISFLPTYQGFVIYSKTSDFHVQKVKTGYVIYPQNENSIALANESVTDFESINWNAYTNLSAQKINNEIQNLKSFILYVASGSKERMHFEMAQLYLSQGLPAPALDILANMPESSNKAKLNFLALILANNPAQALKQWNEITEHSPTLNLWKNTIDDEKLLSTEDFEKTNLSP